MIVYNTSLIKQLNKLLHHITQKMSESEGRRSETKSQTTKLIVRIVQQELLLTGLNNKHWLIKLTKNNTEGLGLSGA